MLIIENIFQVSLTQNRREAHKFHLAREVGKFGDVLAEKKGTLSWLVNSNMVKRKKFDYKLQIFLAANYIALFLPDTNNCFFIWIVPYIHICFYYFLILCFYFHLSSLLLMKHILDFTMFHIIPLQTARNITEIKNTS